MLYNICYVMSYNIKYVTTRVMLCYITYVMLYNIKYVTTCVMLCYIICHVMLYNIHMLCYIT